MTAVAVWKNRPTAEDILQNRLQNGWQPTPSSLKDGDRILGYACNLSSDL